MYVVCYLIANNHFGRFTMYKRVLIFIAMLAAIPVLFLQYGYADQHKKEDVSALISEAQGKLGAIKNGASADLVKSDISRVEEYCTHSQRLLSDGKIDEAYNEVTLANLYFQIIDARIDLQKALVELDDTKKLLSK
jgi:hypothetical protein